MHVCDGDARSVGGERGWLAGDTDGLSGWPVTVGVVIQLVADAERYRCACLHCTQGLAGRGDGYQCGLDWGRSSSDNRPTDNISVIPRRRSVSMVGVHSSSSGEQKSPAGSRGRALILIVSPRPNIGGRVPLSHSDRRSWYNSLSYIHHLLLQLSAR